MLGSIASFWRDTARLYLRYMATGAAALPAGLACAWLNSRGTSGPWVILALLAAAASCGLVVWRWLEPAARDGAQLPFSQLAVPHETSFPGGLFPVSGSALGGFGVYRVDPRSVWVHEISPGILIQTEGDSEQFGDQASGMELPVHAPA
jgi:hypothetical protein